MATTASPTLTAEESPSATGAGSPVWLGSTLTSATSVDSSAPTTVPCTLVCWASVALEDDLDGAHGLAALADHVGVGEDVAVLGHHEAGAQRLAAARGLAPDVGRAGEVGDDLDHAAHVLVVDLLRVEPGRGLDRTCTRSARRRSRRGLPAGQAQGGGPHEEHCGSRETGTHRQEESFEAHVCAAFPRPGRPQAGRRAEVHGAPATVTGAAAETQEAGPRTPRGVGRVASRRRSYRSTLGNS